MTRLRRTSLVAMLVIFLAVLGFSPSYSADLEPLTEEEMGNVTGKTDISTVVKTARGMDKLDVVFKEMKNQAGSVELEQNLLQESSGIPGQVGNTFGRKATAHMARSALNNPGAASRLASSKTTHEMLKVAGKSAQILKGLVGNFSN